MVIEKSPYIIIDNQKIHPIGRLETIHTHHSDDKADVPFGISDKVTISKKARQMYQNHIEESKNKQI